MKVIEELRNAIESPNLKLKDEEKLKFEMEIIDLKKEIRVLQTKIENLKFNNIKIKEINSNLEATNKYLKEKSGIISLKTNCPQSLYPINIK